MIVGALGEITFEVSEKTVKTLDNLQWGGSARYATHERHLYHALTEFTGLDPDTISFDMFLSYSLGVDVMQELVKIWTAERGGISLPLTIGDHAYGKYRWSIVSHKIKYKQFDRVGNVIGATVSVELQEYLRS